MAESNQQSRSHKPETRLSEILFRHRQEIAQRWAAALLELPAFEDAPPDLLQKSMEGSLDYVIQYLAGTNTVSLLTRMTEFSREYLQMNRPISGVIAAILCLKPAALPFIWGAEPLKGDGGREMIGVLDDLLTAVVCLQAELQAEGMARRIIKEKERTALLFRVSQMVSGTLNINEILPLINESLSEFESWWGIYLVHQERFVSMLDPTSDAADHPMDPFTREVMRRQAAIFIHDASQNPLVDAELIKRYGIKSILGLPMLVKNRVIAVALAITTYACRHFTPDEIDLAQSIVNSVALAIENARLYQEVEQLAVTKERARIARELHDTSDQLVTGALFEIQSAQEYIKAGQCQEAQRGLETSKQIIRQIDSYNHLIITGLRPTVLDELELEPALRWYAKTFQERFKIPCLVRTSGRPFAMQAEQETAIYRIVQEALNNVILHAQAKSVAIEVNYAPDDLTVTISDDGVGFEADSVLPHLAAGGGLVGMQERAHEIGGEFKVVTSLENGTRLIISVPVTRPAFTTQKG